MDSPFSLGVVIPCHKPYIPYLRECLDSIESQTVKPSEVVVVCSSSSSSDIPNDYKTGYSFPLKIITRETSHNSAENRNYGSDMLNTDAITFFDADDIMHPQRIEILFEALKDSDVVLHSYMDSPMFERIEAPRIRRNELARGPTGCVVYTPDYSARIHHGHVTLRKGVLDFVRFPENWSKYTRKEDSLFCGVVVSMRHLCNAYIADSLSWYRTTH